MLWTPQEGQHFACTQSRPQDSDCTHTLATGVGSREPTAVEDFSGLCIPGSSSVQAGALGPSLTPLSVLSPLNCPKSHKLPMLTATIPQLRLDPHPSRVMLTAAFPNYPLHIDSRMIFGYQHVQATPASPEGKVEGSQPCTQGAQGSSQWGPTTPHSPASLTSWDPDAKWLNTQPELAGHSFTPTPSLEGPAWVHSATYLARQDAAQRHCTRVPPAPVLRPCSLVLLLDPCHCHPSLLSEGPQRTAITSTSS